MMQRAFKSDRKIGNQRRLRWSQGDLSFFRAFSPCSTLQATWIQHVSQVACRVTNSFVEYYRFDSLLSQICK